MTVIASCAEKEFDPNDAQKSFLIAKEPFDDEYYDMAIQKLGEFKARFPYSKYAIEAELLMADTHFELEHYTEAALSYEQFVKLHPKHPKVDYALFRVGQSYWEDAPEEIDREQEYTKKAIVEWRKLVEKQPDSEYSVKARALIAKGQRRIAESVSFISKFYCKQEIYHACAYRSIQLADEYGEFPDLRIEGLQRAVLALREVAKAKEAPKDEEEDRGEDSNLYFKTMSAQEIRERADNLEKGLNEYKKTVNTRDGH